MKKLLIVLVLLAASGCGINEYRAVIGSRGADASDALLNDSLWAICNAVPVGAIKRRFNSVDKLIQYNAICEDQSRIEI